MKNTFHHKAIYIPNVCDAMQHLRTATRVRITVRKCVKAKLRKLPQYIQRKHKNKNISKFHQYFQNKFLGLYMKHQITHGLSQLMYNCKLAASFKKFYAFLLRNMISILVWNKPVKEK